MFPIENEGSTLSRSTRTALILGLCLISVQFSCVLYVWPMPNVAYDFHLEMKIEYLSLYMCQLRTPLIFIFLMSKLSGSCTIIMYAWWCSLSTFFWDWCHHIPFWNNGISCGRQEHCCNLCIWSYALVCCFSNWNYRGGNQMLLSVKKK